MTFLRYKLLLILFSISLIGENAFAQNKSLVNTSKSSFARLSSVNMQDIRWTNGFWAERFQVCQDSMVPSIWKTYNDPEISHAFRNFEIAAGLAEGQHTGPSFHDGDFYKVLESMAATYSVTRNPELDQKMDYAIEVIGKCQQDDGYLYTQATIEKRNKIGTGKAFQEKINFEAYNLGHLMTAACVHYRATGKSSLLNIAKKATDYLYNYYQKASPELARNAICPSHYMGVVEMYRTTGDPKYLELAKNLIDIRGYTDDGTDDNQDRIPFREQTKAMGHAVRANYLYAGVADVVAETGDTSLLNTLNLMWDDVVYRKMYITGGCGSLYDGVSPDGTSYDPKDVQKIHQAYGHDYQLPNFTAHNETCANIGNVLWNWRMLQLEGKAQYADVMEQALYNSVLSGVSLNGKDFLYTNPLSYSDDLPFKQRWSKDRIPYISLSNCCPPNLVRTIAEVQNYAYSTSKEGVWLNLYGGNTLSTTLDDGSKIQLTQESNYPWDGQVKLKIENVDEKQFSFFLRIPGWSEGATLKINGKESDIVLNPGEYAEVNRIWKTGDHLELQLPMEVQLIEANPLVEATRNQIAVKRGPVVYCLESIDLPENINLFDIAISSQVDLSPKSIQVDNNTLMSLEGKLLLTGTSAWDNQLYRKISKKEPESINLRMIPYFAWGNRGHTDMAVWLPFTR